MKTIMITPMRWSTCSALLAIVCSVLVMSTAQAADLTAIKWDEKAAAPTLQIYIKGKTSNEVTSFEGGQRLRIAFPKTTLASSVSDIEGRGVVKGVYPYVADDGEAAQVDLLLTTTGELKVTSTNYGYQIVVVGQTGASGETTPVVSTPTISTPASDRNVIEDILFAKLPGDRVQVRMKMSKTPSAPATFTISNPARISFDFPDTRVGLEKSSVRVAEGAIVSINAVESENRSRIVFNLVRPAGYSTNIDGNIFTVVVDNPVGGAAGTQASKSTRFAAATKPGKHSLKSIDFRRGPQGDGKVIIGLSDSGVGIDIREQAGEIIVDFMDTNVSTELQRRLDVLDFATPITKIDTFAQGKSVRMVITAKGKYEQLAYQAGDVFTINVKPIITKPGDEREKNELGYSGEKLSLNFQNIDVRAALQVIADFTGLNFVTSDTVTGSLTLRLKDVPWDQALDIILDAKNLTARRSGNVMSVGPADEVAAKEKANLEANKQVLELEPLISELIQINYAKADDIAKLLKSIKAVAGSSSSTPFSTVNVEKIETESNTLLSPRGQVTVDERTNSILIQDTPAKVREVRKLIAQLDQPVRQVMIETRLVEATDDFSRNLGIKWGTVRQDGSSKFLTTTCGTLNCNVDILNGDPILLADNALSVNLGADPVNGQTVGSIGVTLAKLADGNLINLELSALEAEGKGKVISSPRLITANQKKARIEQGQEGIFRALGGVGTTSFITKKAVLALEVTPQITPDDRVILDVLVTKDSFADAVAGLINKKEITTQVLLDNGETVVIGGIYEQTERSTITKVPFFGDLPMLGWLFKKKNLADNKVELLIFLTPRILSDTLSMK